MATKSVSWSIEKLFEADSKDAFDSIIDLSLQSFTYQYCPRWINTVKSSQEREAGTDYSRNGNQISELGYWKIIWSWLKRFFRQYDRSVPPVIFYQHCPRWINTVKSSQERESGTDYSRNGNQISELEYWKIIWSWLKRCFGQYNRPVPPVINLPVLSPLDQYGKK